jgi:hypothetical protein
MHTQGYPSTTNIFATRTHRSYQGFSKFLAPCTWKTYVRTTTSPLGCMNPCTTTSTTPSTATMSPPSAAALLQLRRASWLPVSWLHRLYTSYTMCREYSSPGCTGSTSTVSCASRLLVTRLHGLYLNLAVSHDYSSPGRTGSTSTTPRVRVSRLVARLVVDNFTYATRPGASARRAARRRLLRPHRASGCLGTSRSSSPTTSPTPLRLAQARRRPLHPHRASGCLGTSRGSSWTTRHLATRLLVKRSHWLSPCARSFRLAV